MRCVLDSLHRLRLDHSRPVQNRAQGWMSQQDCGFLFAVHQNRNQEPKHRGHRGSQREFDQLDLAEHGVNYRAWKFATKYTGPSRVTPGRAGARWAQDDKSGGGLGVLSTLRLVLMTLEPLLAQVSPTWIDRNDERSFLDAQPAFDALLAFGCVTDVFESLEVNESVEFVFRRKSRGDACFVFSHPSEETVGDADVQSPRTVRHDVDKIHRSFA